MKKKQDQFLEILRWVLVILCFGIMFIGFYWNYQRNIYQNKVPQIESSASETSQS